MVVKELRGSVFMFSPIFIFDLKKVVVSNLFEAMYFII